MNKPFRYSEQNVTLKHPFHNVCADSALSLQSHFVVFCPDGVCLIFNKSDHCFLKQITLSSPMYKPAAVGPSTVAGISIRQRRLMCLNVMTAEIKFLCTVPMEAYKDDKHQWYYYHRIFSFSKTGFFMYREEAEVAVCMRFFSAERELATMKFKRESMKTNKQVIDIFDGESKVAIYCTSLKRGIIRMELFDCVDSSIKEVKIGNQNLEQLANIQKIKKLHENEMLVCLTEPTEKQSNDLVFVIIDLSTSQILSIFNHRAAKMLRFIRLDIDNHQIIMEQISANKKRFQICFLNYETLDIIEAPLSQIDLQSELNGRCLYKFLPSTFGETKIIQGGIYKKKSLYMHLLQKTGVADLYGEAFMHEIFDIFG